MTWFKFHTLRRGTNNIYPIVPLFFSKQFNNHQNTFYTILQCILNHFNICYIDLKNIFYNLNLEFDLFDDNYHLNQSCSVIIAFLLYKYTKNYIDGNTHFLFNNSKSKSFCLEKEFTILDFRHNFTNKLLNYGSSLINYECISIDNNNTHTISLPISNKFLEGILTYNSKNYSFYASFSTKFLKFDKILNKSFNDIFTFDVFTPKLFITDELIISNLQLQYPKFGYTTFDASIPHENEKSLSILAFAGILLSSLHDEKIFFNFSCYPNCENLYNDIKYSKKINELMYKFHLFNNSYENIIITICNKFNNVSNNIEENPFYLLACAKQNHNDKNIITKLLSMSYDFCKFNAYFLFDICEILYKLKHDSMLDICLLYNQFYPCNGYLTNILSEYFHSK